MKPKKTSANLAGELGRFVQQYGRKAHKGHDPNDRSYDPKLEQKMRRMKPEELSELLYGEEIGASTRPSQRKDE